MENATNKYRFCIAPMMDWTDRHCRYFHRQLTSRARLYTEMVTAQAAIHGDRDHLLGFDRIEHPVALQLGGSDPALLAEASRIGEGFGYDEINLNVGCPSDRVQSGTFGACLMRTPALVAECVGAMAEAVSVPVTVKCRIGVDEQDPEESLFDLVQHCRTAGVQVFIVHARKAWLKGLSPKENRTVPPLDYDLVRKLKASFPDLVIVLNGGLTGLDQAAAEMAGSDGPALDGVMLGRAGYQTPAILADVDERFFGVADSPKDRHQIVLAMHEYIVRRREEDPRFRPHNLTRHMLGLFHGTPGARRWRQMLSAHGANTPQTILLEALEAVTGKKSAAA